MKIIEKILYVIAALLALVFLFMLISIVNPTAHNVVTDIVNKATGNGENESSEPDDNATAEISIPEETKSVVAEDETTSKDESEPKPRPEPKTYEEYADGWTGDGIDDEYLNDAYLNEVINTLGNGDQYDLFIPIGFFCVMKRNWMMATGLSHILFTWGMQEQTSKGKM